MHESRRFIVLRQKLWKRIFEQALHKLERWS
jgi:hypothetical protein